MSHRGNGLLEAKTLLDRKLDRHLEKIEVPTEEVDIGCSTQAVWPRRHAFLGWWYT